MKKTIAILAIAAIVAACGGSTTTTETTDTAAVKIDTIAAPSGGDGLPKENSQNIK